MVTFLSCEYHLLNYFQVVEVFSLVLQEQTIKNLQLSSLLISIYILQLDHPEKDYQKTKKKLGFFYQFTKENGGRYTSRHVANEVPIFAN